METQDKLINFADLRRNNENIKKHYASASSLKLKANAAEVYTRKQIDDKLAAMSTGGEVDLSAYAKTADVEKAISEVQTIKEIAKDDFEDIFSIPEGEVRSEFKLTHTPLGKIRFYVDGIRYFKDCIEYDTETNTVKWINDSSKPEGFDITDADVVIEYDYDTSLGEDPLA